MTNIEELQRTDQIILQRFGTVDVLVNNAGNDMRHEIAEVTPEFWDIAIAVNLRHQFFMSQAVIPSMKKAQRGSIINMSSIGWLIPSTNQVVYVTAKAAVVGMTRTLAHVLTNSALTISVRIASRQVPFLRNGSRDYGLRKSTQLKCWQTRR